MRKKWLWSIMMLILLVGCDFRQRFPINYEYDDFISFSQALENVTYTESDDLYGRTCFFFLLEDELTTDFQFFGSNYGREREQSTSEFPLLGDWGLTLIQNVTDGETTWEFHSEIVVIDDFDPTLIATTATADGFYRVTYQDVSIIAVKGTNPTTRAFVDDHLDNIVAIEVGKNNRPTE
ncbi:MAG: hypothetical protein PHW40_08075 [Candidatus Izemoplasmatales bacterium]|nr:hypothetical protein [Candidatus Izemoplasmatales bacterium]